MFYGQQDYSLDNKRRFSLPREIREKLGPKPIILKHGQTLRIYPQGEEKRFDPVRIRRLKIDDHGRILVPGDKVFLKSIYPLGRKITLAGKISFLEIRPKRKVSYDEISTDEAGELSQRGIRVEANGDKGRVVLKK